MKKKIRREILSKRDALSKEEISVFSKKIISQLIQSDEFKKSKNIFVFISFGSEVETHQLIRDNIETKNVYVPYCSPEDGKMHPVLINNFESLKRNKYGILEPDFVVGSVKPNFDLVIVPGVAFDLDHNRIGYGKGYYDVFFQIYEVKHKIALGFALQICSNPIKSEEHDIPVDKIITEEGIF